MKKTIGIISLVLILALSLVLLPGLFTEAEAAAASSIKVNGYDLPSGYYLPTANWTKTTTKPSGGYFYYNSSGVLTISGVNITTASGTYSVYSSGDLSIALLGTNNITTTGTTAAIKADGSLRVYGSGSLTINASGGNCLYSGGNMTLENAGKLTANSGSYMAIGCYGDRLSIAGNVTAKSTGSTAIYSKADITIHEGTVNATSEHSSYYGIWCQNYVTVNGGTVSVTAKGTGIRSASNVYLYGGNVTVDAGDNGIQVDGSASYVSLKEGKLTVNAGENGIKATTFKVYGGTAYIKSTNESSDSSYCALKLGGNTSSYLQLENCSLACGSTTTSSGGLGKLGSLVYSSLGSYDYVFITSRVYVNGVEVREGEYLPNGKTNTSTAKPSGGYAYLAGGTLTLNSFTVTTSSGHGIQAEGDLKISVSGSNTITNTNIAYDGIRVGGNLEISGGSLKINSDGYSIYCGGNVKISDCTMNLTSTAYYGIYSLQSATIESGSINIDSQSTGIWCQKNIIINGGITEVASKKENTLRAVEVVVNGGVLIANTKTSQVLSGTISIGSGMNNICNTTNTIGYSKVDKTKLSTYKYIAVGDFVTVGGVILQNGYYLMSGSTTPTAGSSGSTYAYYAGDGEVVLRSFTYSGNAHGVHANIPLTVLLDGTSSLTTNGYYGIFSSGDITIKGRTSGTDKLTANASNSVGICTQGALTINGDEIIATGYYAGLDAVNNINITSGIVTATAVRYGVNIVNGSLNINGGILTAISTDTASDSSYSALKLKGNSSTYFKPASGMVQIASTGSTSSNAGSLTVSSLSTYDFVRVGDYVEIFGNLVPSGYSFKDRAVVQGNAGIGSLYYEDGVLTVNSFSGTATTVRAINAFGDLTIQVKGSSNSLTTTGYYAIYVDGDLTIKGSSSMSVTTKDAMAIYCTGDVTISNIGLDATSTTGIALRVTGKVNITAGTHKFTGYYHGVQANTLNITGGHFVARSTCSDTYDSTYVAVKLAGNSTTYFKVPSSYAQAATNVSTQTALEKLNVSNLGTYDYVEVGDFVVVRGVTVYNGYSIASTGNPKSGNGGAGYAYYKDGVLTLTNFRFTGNSVRGIQAFKDLTIVSTTSGSGYANYISTGDYQTVRVEGNLTIKGDSSLEFVSADAYTVNVSGNVNISNINLTVSSTEDTALLASGNVTISSGKQTFNAMCYGVNAAKLIINGGEFVASSSYTANDSSYAAVKLGGNSSSYFQVASGYSEAASYGSTRSDLMKLDYSNLPNFDYIEIGKYIIIRGVNVPDGYSVDSSGNLKSGNGGSGYAYYKDGVLTLTNFRFTGDSVRGIQAFKDLTIVSTSSGTGYANYISTGKYTAVYVAGNLTIQGDSSLELVSTSADTVSATGNVTVDTTLIVTSSDRYALLAGGNLTVKSGNVKFSGGQHGIYVNKVAINGGKFTAISTASTSDASYRAVRTTNVDAASFAFSSSLYAAGGNNSTPTSAEILTVANLANYDYVFVGDFVLVHGSIVPSGQYLDQGKTVPASTTSSSNYLYYANGTLKLNNYTSTNVLLSPRALTMNVVGTNSLGGSYVDGNAGFSGSGTLSILGGANRGISATGNLVVNGPKVTIRSDDKIVVYTSYGVYVSSGTLTVIGTSATQEAISAKDVYVNGGTLEVMAKAKGIKLNGTELKLTSGSVSVTSSADDAINAASGTITVSGGTLTAIGKFNGINANKINVTGGTLEAQSTTTDSTSSQYQAIKGTLTADSDLVKLGAPYASVQKEILDPAKMSSYDYIYIAPLEIKVNGIVIQDGFYLNENASATINSKPSSGRYAYRSGNKVYLYNFAYTAGGSIGIESNGAIEIINSGLSTFSCANNPAVKAGISVTISGSGNLSLTSNVDAVQCVTLLSTTGVDLNLTAGANGAYISYGDMTINGGNVNILAVKNGVVCKNFNMNGGTFLAKSTNTANDNSFSAIGSSAKVTLASGMTTIASTESNGANPGKLDTSKLGTYDYIKIEQGAASSGVTVSGKVTSYITTGTVTIKLFKSGSSTAAYTTTVSAASGTATAFSLTNVAAGTYTMEISKANHVTRTYTITVGSSNVTQDVKICPKGDLNGDGAVNAKDYKLMLQHINKSKSLTGYALECANVNGDANVNAKDMKLILQHVNKSKPLF